MEPLGATDGSVEAAWNFKTQTWRKDFIEVSRELSPPLIRWPGGCLSSYYRWEEGIGPRHMRRPMINQLWGGMETNQIGTHEFIDLCEKLNSDPLITVNFECDGREKWTHTKDGSVRFGGSQEAARWVDYCNNPSNKARKYNGSRKPFNVGLWQIGNETSYYQDENKGFDRETAAEKTRAFAKEMKSKDPNINLIGWGDDDWAPSMIKIAGEYLDFLAFHHHFDSGFENSVLKNSKFRDHPEQAWEEFMQSYKSTKSEIQHMRDQVKGSNLNLALTESHFSLEGRNRCEALSTWAAGVVNARILNEHARNGDILKIATLADFCGTRLQTNAIMILNNSVYMMPVARVMALYRWHTGERAVKVISSPENLDVVGSRTEEKIFLHVVNTSRKNSVPVKLQLEDGHIKSGKIFEISSNPMKEVMETDPEAFKPVQYELPSRNDWEFPPASVSAIELFMKG